MKFKILFLSSVLVSFLVSGVNAAQLEITANENFSSGANFSNNTSYPAFEQSALFVKTSNGGGLWLVRTGGNIMANNNTVGVGRSVYGLYVSSSGAVEFKNSSGDDTVTLQIKDNTNTSNTGTSADNVFGIYNEAGQLKISELNIEANDNEAAVRIGHGIQNKGTFIFEGNALGTNYIEMNNNKGGVTGIGFSNEGGVATINNANVSAKDNQGDGFLANLGTVNVTGHSTHKNKLEVLRNGGKGLFSTGNGVSMNFTDIDVSSQYNGGYGVYAENGSSMTFLSNNDHVLSIVENAASGIFAKGENTVITIQNMDVGFYENESGLFTQNNALVTINGNGANEFESVKNKGHAIAVGDSSKIEFNDMNLSITENAGYAILADSLGEIELTGNGLNSLNIDGNLAHGLVVIDEGKVSVKDMNVYINNNANFGLASDKAGEIDIVGNGSNILQIKDNGEMGVVVVEVGSKLTVTDMDIEIKGNGTNGVVVGDGILNFTGAGSNTHLLTISDNDGIGVLFGGAAAEVNIKDMTIEGSDNNLFVSGLGGGGVVNLTNVDVKIDDDSLLLSAEHGLADFRVKDSKIMNSIFTDVSAGATSKVNLDGVEWKNIGRSNVSDLALSNNNDLYMKIYFGNSSTQGDLLTIDNSAISSGTNLLHITSAGGTGSPNDVIVINQENAGGVTLSDSDFTLANIVDSGFYEYDTLGMDGNNNIILHASNQMSNVAKSIAQMPAVHLNIVKTGMNELRKRLGELRGNSPEVKHGPWARTYAKHLEIDEHIDAKMNLYGLEGGYDYQVYSDCDNKAYIGAMAGYLYTDDIKVKQSNGGDGHGLAQTPSAGLYATWLNKDGWFADATMRYFWSNMKASSETASGDHISYKPNRDFIASSVEFGRRLAYAIDNSSQYIVEPKVEFQYAYAKSKSFMTNLGNDIHYGSTDSKALKVGSLFGYETELQNDVVLEPFVELSVIQEFGGKTSIHYSGSETKSDVSGTSIEISTGLNAKLDDNWNIYSDIAYEKGSVVQSVSGNVGVRYNF